MKAIFSVTLFLSAMLLFAVELIVGKLLLPIYGGSPSTWNTCMCFFQVMLLAGYLYAHLVDRLFGLRQQMLVHLVMMVAGCCLLSFNFPAELGEYSDSSRAILSLFRNLFGHVGLLFFAMAANAPLLQRWFVFTGDARSQNPYFLYAASNAGSVVGLLSYPLLFEPLMTLSRQTLFWQVGCFGLVLLIAGCAILVVRRYQPVVEESERVTSTSSQESKENDRLTGRQRWLWVIYTFLPSSLLLGVTTYISHDIAPLPLLWVVPLAIYLFSFILVFSGIGLKQGKLWARILSSLAIAMILVFIMEGSNPAWLIIPMHLVAFGAACMLCHGQVVNLKPSTRHLTEYYFWISAGGALGGLFNALAAPLLFTDLYEYPLVLIVCLFMIPAVSAAVQSDRQRWFGYFAPALVFGLTIVGGKLALWLMPPNESDGALKAAQILAILVPPTLLTYHFIRRPRYFAVCMLAMFLAGQMQVALLGRTLSIARNFFGTVRVTLSGDGKFHQIIHGNTIHGRQAVANKQANIPLSYHHPTGPAGQVFHDLGGVKKMKQVALVGLGAGALCAYAKPEETWTLYEINPAVIDIARDSRYFTHLALCPAKQVMMTGDARLMLRQAAPHSFDLIVLDAFSSGTIPFHLLTREAMQLYLEKLAPDGILLFHISNGFFQLSRVVSSLSADAGLVSYYRADFNLAPVDRDAGKEASQWALIAHQPADLRGVDLSGWELLKPTGAPLWTDDYSSVIGILR